MPDAAQASPSTGAMSIGFRIKALKTFRNTGPRPSVLPAPISIITIAAPTIRAV